MWNLVKNIGVALRVVSSDKLKTGDEDEESKILKVLDASDSEEDDMAIGNDEHNEIITNLCNDKVGCVTHFTDDGNGAMIDDMYYFDLNKAPPGINIGDRVAYIAYRKSENSSWIVKNVYSVCNEQWGKSDYSSDEETEFENKDESHSAGVSERSVVGKVMKRVGRELFIQPGNYKCSLDKVSTTFIPVIGDWVLLKSMVEIDNDSVDKCGKLVTIESISPLRSYINKGKISHWESAINQGIIDSKVQFNLDACDLGFVPVVGDQVLFKAVESEQGTLTWRALKITPLFEKCFLRKDKKDDLEKDKKCIDNEEINSDARGKSLSEIMRADEMSSDLLVNKNCINITENCNFNDIDLSQEKEIVIIVKNESVKKQELLSASFKSARSLSQAQIKLVSPNLKMNGQNRQFFIYERSSVKFIFKITPRFVGKTSELFVWKFKDFEIGRYITVNIVDKYISDVYDSKLKKFTKKNYDLDSQKVLATRNGFIISAERKFRPAPFVPVKLGHFPVPTRLLEAVLDKNCEDGRREDVMRRIIDVMPYLNDPVNAYNYKQRFHALIYLEEIAALINIRNYDMPRAHFHKRLDYLILEVPGLAEKRPSLICGDTVIVSNPCPVEGEKDIKYEGSIYKICKTEVWLKFNQSFHNSYNGADYTVVFSINRIGYRRCHQAVNVTYDHLSSDWLFPTSLKESKVQISFDEHCDDVENSNLPENNGECLKNSDDSVNNVCVNENLSDKINSSNCTNNVSLPGYSKPMDCSDEVTKNVDKFVNADNSLDFDSSVNNADGSINRTKRIDDSSLNYSSVCDNGTNNIKSVSLTPRMSVAERLKIAVRNKNPPLKESDISVVDGNQGNINTKIDVSDNEKSNKVSFDTPKPSVDNFSSENDSINLNKFFSANNSFKNLNKSIASNNVDDSKVQMKTLEEIEHSLLSKADNNEQLLNDISKTSFPLNQSEEVSKETSSSLNNNDTLKIVDVVKSIDRNKNVMDGSVKSSFNGLVSCDNLLKNEKYSGSGEDCYSKVITPNNNGIRWQTTGRNYKRPTDQLKSKIRDIPKTYKRKLKWFNKKLNYYQKEAVKNILRGEARPLPYIIFGPPGTGKTITLVETALQILQLIPESRLLICTPSNSAANLIAERMLDSGLDLSGVLVRLCSYNYANDDNINISDKLRPFCTTANVKVIEDDLIGTVPDAIGGSSREVLGRHRVTVGTCVTLGVLYNMGFPQGHFTHILVDEAGQATEPEILIPLAFLDEKFGQAIFAGDPMQLGPVVQSRPAINCGFQKSLLSRFLENFPYIRDVQSFPNTCGFDPRIITRLVNNYRSLPEILKLPSTMFYESSLIPQVNETDSKEMRLLMKLKDDLPNRDDVSDCAVKRLPPALIFHGVRGCNFQEEDSPSWFNPQEIVQVIFYVNIFYKAGLNADQVGVVTPYQKQVMKIRSCLNKLDIPLPKIGSVEEFQGQERMAMILSAVRSNSKFVVYDAKHALGFISSPQRLNVALTRARAVLVVLGNPHLLNCDPYWRTVLKYCIDNKAYCGCDLPSELES